MAKTNFTTNNELTKKAWSEKMHRDAVKESYFSKFMSSTGDNIVHEKSELEKQKGDVVTLGLRMRLTGAGVEEGTLLEGNEEALTTYAMQIRLAQYRHAVRDASAISRKRAMFDISAESQAALKDWLSEKIDSLAFDALGLGAGASDFPSKIFYKTSGGVQATGVEATAKSALTAADGKLTLNLLSFLSTWAKTGGNRSYIPLRPVKVDGKPYYVLLTHPDALYDLRTSAEFQQAMREAEVRGPSNPLFENATAIWSSVIVHAHENCAIGTNAGAQNNIPYAKAALLGAQALCWAWGQRPEFVQEDFDFKDQLATGVNLIAGCKRSQFDGKSYGSLGLYLARTNVSGL